MLVTELRGLLARTSWWVQPRTWVLDDMDLRLAREAPFRYSARVLDDLTPGGLHLLRGPRRVGKSVEIKKTVRRLIEVGEDPHRIIHLAADRLAADDLRRAVDAAAGLTPADGPRYWFIDEITAIRDGWPSAVKWLRDNDPRFAFDTVVLTGSSAADLTEAVRELAGRRRAVNSERVLLPMSFREFVRTGLDDDRTGPGRPPDYPGPMAVADLTHRTVEDAVRRIAPWIAQLVEQWEAYLTVGGFPQAVAAHRNRDEGAAHRLGESLLEVIHGEAFRRSAWSRAQSNELLRRLAVGVASPINHHDVARDVGSSAQTVRRRLDRLRESFVTWRCHRERGLRPSLRAQEKTYFTDPGYTRLVGPGKRSPGLPSRGFGQVSEQQLGLALARTFARDDPGSYLNFDAVLYHRTRTRKEIDFVGPGFGDVAIESKYVDGGGWRKSVQTMRASPWRGVIATRSALDLGDPDCMAVPTGLLVWLVGG